MKFGLTHAPYSTPERKAEDVFRAQVEQVRLAETLGFDSAFVSEHHFLDNEMFPSPLVALGFLAAATSKIRLGTGVNILSQTNPLLLAKQAASLDCVSGGRFMLGVGIGWLQEEFVAMGTPFERRGARFDDYVTAMRKVWSGAVVEHQSEFLNWRGFKSYPLPRQNPLPVIIGGNKGKIYERIARLGNGWFVPGADPAELKRQLAELRTACERVGRDVREIEITCMWPGRS